MADTSDYRQMADEKLDELPHSSAQENIDAALEMITELRTVNTDDASDRHDVAEAFERAVYRAIDGAADEDDDSSEWRPEAERDLYKATWLYGREGLDSNAMRTLRQLGQVLNSV